MVVDERERREHGALADAGAGLYGDARAGDDGAHRWNYPGSISLQYEAASVARAVRAGAVEAPEWTHADSLAAHRIVERVRDQCYAPTADVDAAKPGDF